MEGTCTILGAVLVLGIGGIIITVGYFCAETAVVTVEQCSSQAVQPRPRGPRAWVVLPDWWACH